MTSGDLFVLVGAGLSLLGAAFFSAAQTALTRMSLVRALKLDDEGRRGAQRVVRLLKEPVRTLNTLALLVLVLEVTGAALLVVVVDRYTVDFVAVGLGALTAAAVLFVGAEIAPRTLAVQRTDLVAVATARWVALFTRPLWPVAAVLVRVGDMIAPGKRLPQGPYLTQAELREAIDVAESDDVIESSERQMLHRIFKLGDTVVREIMTPRPDMTMVSTDQPLTEVVEVILTAGHSRVPVHAGDREEVLGLIYAKDVLRRLHDRGTADGPWADLMRPPHVVPELATVDHLLADMQAQKVHIAVVVDEYGGTAGLVTIEDVLEEIVGEIVDEYDSEEQMVEEIAPDRWRVDARLPVEQLNDLVEANLPDGEWDSVGGLVFGVLGRVPQAGETLELDALRLTAERVEGRRITTVVVERVAEQAEFPLDQSVA